MGNDEFHGYLAHEQNLVKMRELALDEHKRRLAESADKLVLQLKALGAHRIWLFGSVARGQIRLDSDLDMAVEGLPYAQDELLGIAERVLPTEVNIDLIPWQKAHPELRAHILSEGRLLYDRESGTDTGASKPSY